MKVGSLFSGIGGLDLGLERAGMTVVWQSEIDPYASRVLDKHWPNVPNLGDITTIDWSTVEPVDLICGGYPCQPFSLAGARAGEGDARHLWPYFAVALRHLRPRWALLENVPGHLSLGFGQVHSDLADLGYDTEWDCIPAAAVGAPHLRYRVFVVAHTNGDGLRQQPVSVEWGSGATVTQHDGGAQHVADTDCQRLQSPGPPGGQSPRWLPSIKGSGHAVADADCTAWHAPGAAGEALLRPETLQRSRRRGGSEWEQWAVEPDVGRVAYGVPSRVDRLKCLGNAVVPQVAEWVGRRIMASVDADLGTAQSTVGVADVAASGAGQQVGEILPELVDCTVGCDVDGEGVVHLPHNDKPARDVKRQSA